MAKTKDAALEPQGAVGEAGGGLGSTPTQMSHLLQDCEPVTVPQSPGPHTVVVRKNGRTD